MGSSRELLAAFRAWPIWMAIAKDDVMGRYRRTVLGPFWLVLSQAGFVLGIYLLHRTGFGGSSGNFLLYLAASLPIWALIIGLVTDGSNAMLWSKEYLESFPLPPAIFVIRVVASSLTTFAHTILVFIFVFILQRQLPNVSTLAFAPGIAIIVLFGIGIGLTLGPLGARFRDIPAGLGALTGLLFVLTPIFWVPTEAQIRSPLVALNPFYYLLEVGRGPLLGDAPEPRIWIIALLIAAVSFVAGLIVYSRTRPNLVYWL